VSAPPDSDDAARLPCLTTGIPHAATTIDAIVDRFTVFAPSPPVPTTSTASANASLVIRRACTSIASASSVTSAEVGRFIFMATAKPAIWAGVATPVMISFIAQDAWPVSRFWPVVSRPRIWGQARESSEATEVRLIGRVLPGSPPRFGQEYDESRDPGGVKQLQSVILHV